MQATFRLSSFGLFVPALLAFAAMATAQEGGGGAGIEEMVVTAQKREQSLQDVPVAVSAYDSEFLSDISAKDLRDLVDVTPGFAGRTEDGFIDALSVRGISTNDYGVGGDPSVAIFVDGFYEGRNGGVITSMLDIERAEVVKGPQGTLFGRNAIAGAISITTQKPVDVVEGKLSVGAEEFGHFEATGTVNMPVTDRVYFRASMHHLEDGGYLENLAGGSDLGFHNRQAAQAALRYAGDQLDAVITAMYEDRRGSPSVYWPTSFDFPEDQVNTDLADNGKDEADVLRVVANVEYEFDSGYTLSGIGGIKDYDFFYLEDYDALPVVVDHYLQDQQVNYYSGELRLNSPESERLFWFVGGSFYHEDVGGRFQNIYTEDDLCRAIVQTEVGPATSPDDFTWAPGTTVTGCDDPLFELVWGDDVDPTALLANKPETNVNKGVYTGWAIYGDATWSVTDQLDLVVGARYTHDNKEYRVRVLDSGGALGNNFAFEFFTNGFVETEDDWSDFTPRVAVNYRWTDDISLYANVAKGFKSGGFATFGLDLPGDPLPSGAAPPGTLPKKFDPEEVLSIEGGIKARWLDGRLATNISIYDYSYNDLQLSFFVGGSNLVDNVAEASGFGGELELQFVPDDHWNFLFTAAYLDTEIDKVDQDFLDLGGCADCAGNSLWFAPKWSTSAILTYRRPLFAGDVFFTVEDNYESSKFAGPDNIDLARTPAWNEMNLRVGFNSGHHWSGVLYLNNVFDETYFERGWENADADDLFGYGLHNTLVWPSKPRTIGVRVEYEF